jgi:tungstate transport system ATP-binding protein
MSGARTQTGSAGGRLPVKLRLADVLVRRGDSSILDVPELEILDNEVLAIVGPNGAGKSTLLQVIGLLMRPDRGEVLFEGKAARGNPLAFRRRMSLVMQEPLLLDTTVEGNVRCGLALRGVPAAEQRRRAATWMERFGIAALASRSPRYLSGGEAQRVSLARAFVLEPEVLLLDEPFSALDAPTREALIDDLDDALRDRRATTVFVTHDRAEALRLGDRIAVMIGGGIRQVGTPAEVFGAAADEEVAAFVGVETIVRGRVTCLSDGLATLEVCGVSLQAAPLVDPSEDVLVCIRPEDVIVARLAADAPASSARNHVPATVVRVLPAGPHVRVVLDAGDAGFQLVALITRQSLEELELAPGSRIEASFKATAVHLIPHRRQG